ncbi:MAG: RT0821/Lpp0805 family surface protein, partial [Burkholderiales bacterium]|nr:RT0821/Lpp0805 family surface protein [Burkholderiales bacterium]
HGGRRRDVMSTFWRKSVPVLALTLFVAMTPASAQNLGFMKDAPIARFTDQDMQLFKQTLNDVLDDSKLGEARSWSNPDTKARGEVTAIKSFERDAVPCRRVAIKNWAKGRSASGQYNFCKQASGQWAPAN